MQLEACWEGTMAAVLDQNNLKAADAPSVVHIKLSPSRAARSSTSPVATPKAKFKAEENGILITSKVLNADCSAVRTFSHQTSSAYRNSPGYGANDIAIAAIWLIALTLIVGIPVVTPLISGAIDVVSRN
jgi:hypothetical protein